jgi:hypothetical protein
MNAADSSWRTCTKRMRILALSQRLHDAVYTVARQPENGIDAALQQALHHPISRSRRLVERDLERFANLC